jgi:hypothetical protein
VVKPNTYERPSLLLAHSTKSGGYIVEIHNIEECEVEIRKQLIPADVHRR